MTFHYFEIRFPNVSNIAVVIVRLEWRTSKQAKI